MMALDNTFLFSTQPFGHGDANELLNPLGNFSSNEFLFVESISQLCFGFENFLRSFDPRNGGSIWWIFRR
jgi:hypothetical protein